MSEKSFKNELARALARPDADQLKSVIAAYHDWNARGSSDKTEEWSDGLDIWFDASHDNHEMALALVVLAAATYDDPAFLALVAAGPLEELLCRDRGASEAIVQRILDEARRTPRFRWMLSCVWTMSARPELAAAVAEIVSEMTDESPLPPRPWA